MTQSEQLTTLTAHLVALNVHCLTVPLLTPLNPTHMTTPGWFAVPLMWHSQMTKCAVLPVMNMPFPSLTDISHPAMTYGSSAVPEPATTPFSAVNSASLVMKIGALRLNAVVFEGIEVRTKARLDVNRATIKKAR